MQQPKLLHMKKIILKSMAIMLFTFCQHAGFSQLPINKDGKVEYTDVVNVDSVTATKLLEASRIFITKEFVSGKDVTQFTDEQAKSVMGKGWFPATAIKALGMTWGGDVWFTLLVQCKDYKYRYSFTDFKFRYHASMYQTYYANMEDDHCQGLNKKQWARVKDQVDQIVTSMITDLKKQTANAGNNDF
jgi:hypothetical protein